jgi:hypothetical protein
MSVSLLLPAEHIGFLCAGMQRQLNGLLRDDSQGYYQQISLSSLITQVLDESQ